MPNQETVDECDLHVRHLRLRAVREETREADFVASTDAVDSYGEIVDQSWDLTRYKANPVILWSHQSRELPIGQSTRTEVVDGQLECTVRFASEKANPKAEQVWQGFKEGTIRALSVGFDPKTVRVDMRNGQDVVVCSDNELMEISVVSIPANPEALAKRRERALAAARERAAVPYSPEIPVDHGTWDAAEAESSLKKWASKDGSGTKDTIDWAKYKRGFAWFDASNPESFGSYKLPHHQVDSGKLDTIKAGVIAAGNAMQGAREGVNIPDADVEGVKAHLEKHYRQFDMSAPWEPKKTGAPVDTKISQPAERGPTKEDDMDPKEKAALDEKMAAHERKIGELETKATTNDLEIKTLKAQTERLATERDTEKDAREKVEGELIELEVGALVGKKIAPAEKETFVELRKTNKSLFEKMITQRSDMHHTAQVIPDAKMAPGDAGADQSQADWDQIEKDAATAN